MGCVKILALAGATALLSTATLAADFPAACRRPCRWPSRRRSNRRLVSARRRRRRRAELSDVRSLPDELVRIRLAGELAHRPEGHRDTAFVGFGIGYPWNNWLRFDVTGEYRTDVKFKAIGSYTEFCPNGGQLLRRLRRRAFVAASVWPTPISISGPGGASRRSSARGVGGAYHTGHRRRPMSAIIADGVDWLRLSRRPDSVKLEFRLGRPCRRRLQRRRTTSRSSSPIAT